MYNIKHEDYSDVFTQCNPRKNQCKCSGKNPQETNKIKLLLYFPKVGRPQYFFTWKININKRHPSSLFNPHTAICSSKKVRYCSQGDCFLGLYFRETFSLSFFFSMLSVAILSIRMLLSFPD